MTRAEPGKNTGRSISVRWINESVHWLITSSYHLHAHPRWGIQRGWFSEGEPSNLNNEKKCDRLRSDLNHLLDTRQSMAHFPGPVGGSLLMESARRVCFGTSLPVVPAPLPLSKSGNYHTGGLFLESLWPLPFGFLCIWLGLIFRPMEARGSSSCLWAFRFFPLAGEAAMLSKVKRLNGSFRSREVLSHGLLCSRHVGQREEGAGTDPKRREPPAVRGLFLTTVPSNYSF